MNYEFDLALSLMKSRNGKHYLNSNVVLSTLGIMVGIMVLILTLVVYDGYVKKMETIIFSLFPQITIKSTSGLLDNRQEDEKEEDFCFPFCKKENEEQKLCNRICAGEVILSDTSEKEARLEQINVLTMAEVEQIIKTLEVLPAVTTVRPVIFEQGRFKYSYWNDNQELTQESNLRILGVQFANNRHYIPEIERLLSTQVLEQFKESDTQTAIISAALYQNLFGYSPSENEMVSQKIQVTLMNGQRASTTVLKIVGIFRLGIHQITNNLIITRFSTAQKMLGMSGYASMVGFSLNKPFEAKTIAKQMDGILKEKGIQEIIVFHWLQVADDLFNSLSLYRRLVFFVLLMSIFITAFNIYNNLAIMILERRQQIGLLMSMGMKKRGIYKIFFIISQIEGLLGSLMGIGFGILVGYWFNVYLNYNLTQFLPVADSTIMVNSDVIIMAVFCVSIVCAVISVIIARQACRLDVVETLQIE